MSTTTFATAQEVQLAKERHCYGTNDEIEVDENTDSGACVLRGEDGAWVRAWLFVPKELIDDYRRD